MGTFRGCFKLWGKGSSSRHKFDYTFSCQASGHWAQHFPNPKPPEKWVSPRTSFPQIDVGLGGPPNLSPTPRPDQTLSRPHQNQTSNKSIHPNIQTYMGRISTSDRADGQHQRLPTHTAQHCHRGPAHSSCNFATLLSFNRAFVISD